MCNAALADPATKTTQDKNSLDRDLSLVCNSFIDDWCPCTNETRVHTPLEASPGSAATAGPNIVCPAALRWRTAQHTSGPRLGCAVLIHLYHVSHTPSRRGCSSGGALNFDHNRVRGVKDHPTNLAYIFNFDVVVVDLSLYGTCDRSAAKLRGIVRRQPCRQGNVIK